MSKDQYEEYKKQEHVPMELWWEYWKEKKPAHYRNLELEEFAKDFTGYMSSTRPVLTPRGLTMFHYGEAAKKVYEYYDEKFAGQEKPHAE